MLWLGGFLSLDLTTGTPDAFCPPLEEARAAVQARVGEVRGDYHAAFSLIRSDDGQQKLKLTLHEGPQEVLLRELPLDAAGCQDAAQTIALILERYFDAIERPAPVEPAAKLESVPVVVGPTPQVAAPRDRVVETAREPVSLGVDARAGTLYDQELGFAAVIGASVHPAPFRLTPSLGIGVALELAPFFARQTEIFRERQVEAFLLQGALAVPLTWTRGKWRVSGGPWFQLRLQRAAVPSVADEQSAVRALPGLGGFVRFGVDLTSSVGLAAGVAAGPQVRGAASRFLLDGAAGQIAVLVPDAWFGHGQLTLELKL